MQRSVSGEPWRIYKTPLQSQNRNAKVACVGGCRTRAAAFGWVVAKTPGPTQIIVQEPQGASR
jgi:hypothetical protein